ncbi:hypothetical protein BN1095_7990002 [Clostridioides difficile]|uniref:Uncharacterized protein n=1 Tax=Clostridioides difficile TaxID=1496 RepID=A0A069AZD6_CLODI|nr:hypothetical protein BN1095_7990002 [Clostridioides difficile]
MTKFCPKSDRRAWSCPKSRLRNRDTEPSDGLGYALPAT